MFLEYCSKGTLQHFLKKEMKIKEDEAIKLFKQMAQGSISYLILKMVGCLYLYEKSVIHRDLKPSNILFDEKNVLKIADFGFAKLMQSRDVQLEQTKEIGTPIYMSPQVSQGQRYSIKADIWSLGIIFYQVIVGMTPEHFCQPQQQLCSETLQFPPSAKISNSMKELIKSMLEMNEDDRLSIQQLVNKLNEFDEDKCESLEKEPQKKVKI